MTNQLSNASDEEGYSYLEDVKILLLTNLLDLRHLSPVCQKRKEKKEGKNHPLFNRVRVPNVMCKVGKRAKAMRLAFIVLNLVYA